MKRNIAIVAGGDSSEHNVSLRSAEGIMSFMDKDKYNCYIVEVTSNNWKVEYHNETCHIDRADFSFTAKDGRHTFDFAYITFTAPRARTASCRGISTLSACLIQQVACWLKH